MVRRREEEDEKGGKDGNRTMKDRICVEGSGALPVLVRVRVMVFKSGCDASRPRRRKTGVIDQKNIAMQRA